MKRTLDQEIKRTNNFVFSVYLILVTSSYIMIMSAVFKIHLYFFFAPITFFAGVITIMFSQKLMALKIIQSLKRRRK